MKHDINSSFVVTISVPLKECVVVLLVLSKLSQTYEEECLSSRKQKPVVPINWNETMLLTFWSKNMTERTASKQHLQIVYRPKVPLLLDYSL